MAPSIQVTFRDAEPSPALEQRVRSKLERLLRSHPEVVRCEVVLSVPHRHGRKGHLYDVRIHFAIPGDDVVVAHESPNDHAHEDPYVAVRDAFAAAERALAARSQRRRHEVKKHEPMPEGRVVRWSPRDHHGMLESDDGVLVYFHEHAVIEGIDELSVGDRVRFVLAEGEGEKGPQASTVHRAAHRGSGASV